MIKQLCYLGNPFLRKKCTPVTEITEEVLRIAEELIDTMEAHSGLGLAAPQIGYAIRMFAIQVSDEIDDDGHPLEDVPSKIFINPNITKFSKKTSVLTEGCLSIPGFREKVIRPKSIDIEALGIDGKMFEEKNLQNWRARCCLHEIDHLEGILFIDLLDEELKKEHEIQLRMLEMQYKKPTFQKDPFQ